MQNQKQLTALQKAFEDSGLKYHELANMVGISKSYCYKIINYNLRVYYDVAVKISNVLGKETDILFNEQEKNFEHEVSLSETKGGEKNESITCFATSSK
ncbi:helix-turn-helix domain-containing protein [Bacillus cereus]|uniref:Helix-turn-helix transcriptional regulator n=1 Tax=Bacillus cereus TaxID=1396 RepID=A0ABD7DK08_BACCE|nr:helix-turn-helix transcriptional regulator [Bacillus cereus]QRY16957.1 helix-turn-helix transcriptional regulator [Bacillus cereus]